MILHQKITSTKKHIEWQRNSNHLFQYTEITHIIICIII